MLVSSLLVVVILLNPIAAHADCVTSEKATAASDCVVMKQSGVQGVWFDMATANKLRKLKLEMPELRLQLTKHEQLLAVERERAALYLEAASVRAEALSLQDKQVDKALAKGAAAEARADVWYRHPTLWLTIGSLITTAVITAVIRIEG